MQQRFSPHDWAAVFRVVAASAVSATAARYLRATCRTAQLGYDCAVQAGWIALAGHRSDEPEEEGATCMWINGWFPVSLTALLGPTLRPSSLAVRLEHRLVCPVDTDWLASRRWSAFVVVVAETLSCAAVPSLTTGALDSRIVNLCDAMEEVRFSRLASTTISSSGLFRGAPHVRIIDTSGMTSIVAIGSHFASGCKSLTTLDVSGLSSVTAIGAHFASNCDALSSVRARRRPAPDSGGAFASVTSLGDAFLHGCPSLAEVELSGLRNLREIPSSFLCCAKALGRVDLSALTAATAVGDDVLACCDALRSVDLSGLTSVTAIGSNFLSHATTLELLDVTGLRGVISIDEGFVFNCVKLRSCDPSPLVSLSPGDVDLDYFMHRTPVGETDEFEAWKAQLMA